MSENPTRLLEGFYELKIYTENPRLLTELAPIIKAHNIAFSNNTHPDSGFDLLTPFETVIPGKSSHKINLEVKCAMVFNTYNSSTSKAYYLYPRSSTGSKTTLRLANSVGIIDSGYRGNLQCVFDNISDTSYTINQFQRLVQVCLPSLEPFMVSLVDNESQLGETKRGSKGFGSTGK